MARGGTSATIGNVMTLKGDEPMARIKKVADEAEKVPTQEQKEVLKSTPLLVEPLKMVEVALCILGASPFIYNRLSSKAQRELLLPAGTKNRAAKRAELKHDPLKEFRASVYADPSPGADTRLVFPSPGFKAAAMTAALEIPGATKASVGRLLQVVGYQVRMYGIPQLFMCGVRSAGMNRTPDIRTRAILPEWATQIIVRYPASSIDPSSVGNLFAAAGQICGVGDFRQEKGKGSFGLFSLVNADDPDWKRIVATGGAAVQDAALKQPEAFNDESAELWAWFEETVTSRGRGEEMTRVEAN